jgi:hypothetical protein
MLSELLDRDAIDNSADADDRSPGSASHLRNIHLRRIQMDFLLDSALRRLAGVNQQQPAVTSGPGPVLDSLGAVGDAVRPRLLNG